MDESWRYYAKWITSGAEGGLLWDCIYMRHLEIESRVEVTRAGGRRGMESYCLKQSFSFGGWESSRNSSDGCKTLWMHLVALNFPPKNSKVCCPYFTMAKKWGERRCKETEGHAAVAEAGLPLRQSGAGSRALNRVPAGLTHLHPVCQQCWLRERAETPVLCTRHIVANYDSHWHALQGSTRPWRGHLQACHGSGLPSITRPREAQTPCLPTLPCLG